MEWLHVRVVRGSQKALAKKNSIKSLQDHTDHTIIIIIIIIIISGACGGAEVDSADQLYDRRVARILTSDLPRYFAVISRVRQESHYIGAEGLAISSSVTPQVQVVFPPGALTKSISVGLQVRNSWRTRHYRYSNKVNMFMK